MKKLIVSVMLFVGAVLSRVHFAAAQEAVPVAAPEAGAPVAMAQEFENDKFSFGKVVSVAADQVTVKEYDFAKDADVEVVYVVAPETEYGNVNAITDLAVNDDIVIDYVEKDGKRVITTLVKEEKGAEAPMADVAEVPAQVESAPAEAMEAPAQEVAPAVTEATPVPEGTAPVQQ